MLNISLCVSVGALDSVVNKWADTETVWEMSGFLSPSLSFPVNVSLSLGRHSANDK